MVVPKLGNCKYLVSKQDRATNQKSPTGKALEQRDQEIDESKKCGTHHQYLDAQDMQA
jgi:hypothetical protein